MTEKEFTYFSEAQRSKLTLIAGRLVRGTADRAEVAEDIVQEALISLWKLLRSGYPVDDPEALAVTITKNISISHYRKTRLRYTNIETAPIRAESGERAQERTEESDRRQIKERLYSHLSQTQRKYMQLREEGMSLDAIASAVGHPKTSIKTTLSAARKKLLEELQKTL